MALALLVSLAALLTVAAAAITVVTKSYGATTMYQGGLASAYGAESGANWGLAYIRGGGEEGRTASFTENDIRIRVRVTVKGTDVEIRSSAQDEAGKYKRFLTLTCVREEKDGSPVVTVKDVSANAFKGD